MKVAVVGSGYVGLVTGTCFAEMGNQVICVDNDQRKIDMLKNGKIPIYEPGLEEMVNRNASEGRLSFTTDLKQAVQESLVLFIAVGTPPDEDGSADLQYVIAVAREIAESMTEYRVIVDKSTVPVGTADKVKAEINRVLALRHTDVKYDVVSNPEFLKEGAALDDFMKPDRIVIGVDSDHASEIMKMLYAPFNRTNDRVVLMSIRSAEMTKYAANAMLATKISFMNEISRLCELYGADVSEVRVGIGSDPRIGFKFIYPGVGYGGSCFPKDVKALVHMAKQVHSEAKILTAVEEVNAEQKLILVNKVKKEYGENLSGKVFAIWGLAFKPQTDDMREAPALVIIDALIAAGATVRVFDPVAIEEAKRRIADNSAVYYAQSEYEALENADGLLLVTEWHQFRYPDFSRMKELLKSPVVFDGRNQYDPAQMRSLGFTYYSIGRL